LPNAPGGGRGLPEGAAFHDVYFQGKAGSRGGYKRQPAGERWKVRVIKSLKKRHQSGVTWIGPRRRSEIGFIQRSKSARGRQKGKKKKKGGRTMKFQKNGNKRG